MMTNSNATSTTATKAAALGGSSSNRTAVPGLPQLPDTDTPLQSVQEDARAAIAALRRAVDYDGRKKVPSTREPVWRRGVSSYIEGGGGKAAAAFAATTAAAAVTARADGAAGGRGGGPVPEGVVVEEYEILSEERETAVDGSQASSRRERLWVPLTVARPAASSSGSEEEASSSSSSSSYPALFLLHSTAGSRAKTRARLLRAAERGYVALAPDFRYFGTRGRLWEAAEEDTNTTNTNTKLEADFALYESELVRSFRGGGAEERPFLIDNLWDLKRVLDWLFFVGTTGGGDDEKEKEKKNTKLFNVDASRVGTTGISLGGLHSVLFAILEQERIAAVAPAIGVPTFAWGAAHGGEWEPRAASIPKVFDVAASDSGFSKTTAEDYVRVLNAVAPGLLGPFDASRSLAAIAPRPLLIANGARDGRNPLGGVGQAVARAAKIYESQNKSGNLEYFLDEGAGHEYTPVLEEKVDAWLDKWLLKEK